MQDKRIKNAIVDDGLSYVAAYTLRDTIKRITTLVQDRGMEDDFTEPELMKLARLVFLYEGLRARLDSAVGDVHTRPIHNDGVFTEAKKVLAVAKHHLTQWFEKHGKGPEEGRAYNLMQDGFEIAEVFAAEADGMGFLSSASPGGSLDSIMKELGALGSAKGQEGATALRAQHALMSYVTSTVVPQIGTEMMLKAAQKDPKLAAALAKSGLKLPADDGDDTKTVVSPFPMGGSSMTN